MKIMSNTDLLAENCRLSGKWGMLVSWDSSDMMEVMKAAPYLKIPNDIQVLGDGGAFLFFDTEQEMNQHFDMTVGDDGPTKSNPYDGECRVYALTCSNKGEFLTENT